MTAQKQPVIAITGATGFLGSILVDYFIKKKWRVIALVRNTKEKPSNPNLEYREYDIIKPLSQATLKGVDYIIHAAFVKLDTKHPDAFQVNIDGAKNLLVAAKDAHIKQAVFISSMSAHEEAISVYGRQKLAIEKLFLETKRATVLRCGLIIGNGGIVKEMAQFMKSKHIVPLIGGGSQPLQIISVYDLSSLICNVIEKKHVGLFVAAHPTVYSYREFYKKLAHQLNTFVAYIPVPYWGLQFIFKIATILRIPLGVGEDNLKGLKKLVAMPSANDMKRLGVKPLELAAALDRTNL